MAKLTCLYCFEKFDKNEIQFRCCNNNYSICPPEKDIPYQNYLGLASEQLKPKVITRKPGNNSKNVKCTCGSVTKPICPMCHNELPNHFGETKSCIIALIGAKESGKSHYITVLIHELKQRIGVLFNTSLNALDEWTIKQYNDNLWRHVYSNKEVIPATISAKVDVNVKRPLVYRIKLESSRFFIFKKETEVHLVFFDTAGEDLTNIDIMRTENKYIAGSDGIIFLLDPLQIPAVADKLSPTTSLPTENTSQEDIINRATMLIQNTAGLKPSEKISIPVAVSFSKIDELHNMVDPVLLRSSNHNGYFDINDKETVNDLFIGYVDKWFGPNLIKHVENFYKTFSFFGLSALGSSPDNAGKINRGVSPFRIEDPLLWILYKKGIIKGKRI
jgi:GTPase SAR1 family protein